jgi:hypothetical protein
MRRLLFSAFAIAAAAAFSASALATTITSVQARLSTPARLFTGKCPATFTFNGLIMVNGTFDSPPGSPDEFAYQFARSDGTATPTSTFTFQGSGIFSKNISNTWTLGGPALPMYSGWEELRVWPVRGGFPPTQSERVTFDFLCAKPPPTISLSANLSALPTSYRGRCPATIKFDGTITAKGSFLSGPAAPDQVAYQFVRSDNSKGPISLFTISGTGTFTKQVSTTWTLSPRGTPPFRGWEQLNVWLTNGALPQMPGPKASFSVTCG